MCIKPTSDKILLTLVFFVLLTTNLFGQVTKTVDTVLSQNVQSVSNIQQQLKFFKGLIPSKKAKDTVYVLITNILLSDPNLKLLKNGLSKGKKELKMSFKENTVILKVVGSKNAGDVYDALDDQLKKIFEPRDIADSQMLLHYTPH